MRTLIIGAAALGILLGAPAAFGATPPPGIQAIAAAHPGGSITAKPLPQPNYVYGQAACYSQFFQYFRGTGAGLALEGLSIRVDWCAVPGLAPRIYAINTGTRYQTCTGLIQCKGMAGPFLASGGLGWGWADYELIGYYGWQAQGINASGMLHLAFEVQENGVSWSYGWS
jgi:hypothetical protein